MLKLDNLFNEILNENVDLSQMDFTKARDVGKLNKAFNVLSAIEMTDDNAKKDEVNGIFFIGDYGNQFKKGFYFYMNYHWGYANPERLTMYKNQSLSNIYKKLDENLKFPPHGYEPEGLKFAPKISNTINKGSNEEKLLTELFKKTNRYTQLLEYFNSSKKPQPNVQGDADYKRIETPEDFKKVGPFIGGVVGPNGYASKLYGKYSENPDIIPNDMETQKNNFTNVINSFNNISKKIVETSPEIYKQMIKLLHHIDAKIWGMETYYKYGEKQKKEEEEKRKKEIESAKEYKPIDV